MASVTFVTQLTARARPSRSCSPCVRLRESNMQQLTQVLLTLVALLSVPATAGPAATRPLTDPAPISPHYASCTNPEQDCLSRGLLPFSVDGRCYEPLSRGPCTEQGFWFGLDPTALASSSLTKGSCVRRQCPVGKFPHEGQCLTSPSARARLCAGSVVHLDPQGNSRCGDFPGWRSLLPRYLLCIPVTHPPTTETTTTATDPTGTVIGVGGRPCAMTNAGNCVREVITPTTARTILIESED